MSLALAIGPISLLIIQRTINRGLRSGVYSGMGAALGDFTCALIAFYGGSLILEVVRGNEKYVQLFSSSVLLMIAIYIFIHSLRTYLRNPSLHSAAAHGGDLVSIFFFTLSNPLTIVSFLGFIGQLSGPQSLLKVLTLSFCVFAGSLPIQWLLACTTSLARRFFFTPKTILALNIASALGIAAFAFATL